MPGFSPSQIIAKFYCGIVTTFPIMVFNSLANLVGYGIYPYEGGYHAEVTVLDSAIGGSIAGTFATLAFVEEIQDRPINFRPYEYVRGKGFMISLLVTQAASLIGDAIASSTNTICPLVTYTHFPCDKDYEFVSVFASRSLLGSIVLGSSITLVMLGSKLITQVCDRSQVATTQAAQATLLEAGELETRLSNCHYEGSIPPDFEDPVLMRIMDDPASLPCGHNFERANLANIREHSAAKTCPCCRDPFDDANIERPTRNIFLRNQIKAFVEDIELKATHHHAIDIKEEENLVLPPSTPTLTDRFLQQASETPNRMHGFFQRLLKGDISDSAAESKVTDRPALV